MYFDNYFIKVCFVLSMPSCQDRTRRYENQLICEFMVAFNYDIILMDVNNYFLVFVKCQSIYRGPYFIFL